MSDFQQLDAADSKRKNEVKHKMGVLGADEATGGPSTNRSGAKQNETKTNIRSRGNSQHHTESESEENPSEPKSKLAASKSKVIC